MRYFTLFVIYAVLPNASGAGWAVGLLSYMEADPEVRDIIHRARRPTYDDDVRDAVLEGGMRSLAEKASLGRTPLLNVRNIVALAMNAHLPEHQDAILMEGLEALINRAENTGGRLSTEDIIALAVNAHSNDNHEALLRKAVEHRSLIAPDGAGRLAQAAHTNDRLRRDILRSLKQSPCQRIGVKLSVRKPPTTIFP